MAKKTAESLDWRQLFYEEAVSYFSNLFYPTAHVFVWIEQFYKQCAWCFVLNLLPWIKCNIARAYLVMNIWTFPCSVWSSWQWWQLQLSAQYFQTNLLFEYNLLDLLTSALMYAVLNVDKCGWPFLLCTLRWNHRPITFHASALIFSQTFAG